MAAELKKFLNQTINCLVESDPADKINNCDNMNYEHQNQPQLWIERLTMLLSSDYK